MKKIVITLLVAISFFIFGFKPERELPQDGKTLYMSNYAACHAPDKGAVGPPFQGIRKDYPQAWIYGMIRNHDSMCKTEDIRAKYLTVVWHNVSFNIVFDLSDKEINSILDYVDSKPMAKDYYRHRKMSEQELKAIMDFTKTIEIDTDLESIRICTIRCKRYDKLYCANQYFLNSHSPTAISRMMKKYHLRSTRGTVSVVV
jgi:mono/diheme cytochrome c family protein